MKKKEINYINNTLKDIENKVVIVTGANSGIGYSNCDILLYKKAHIVMACRNISRANAAKEKLLKDHPDGKIDILLYDQSTVEGAKKFVKDVIDQYPNFYALVLNAGLMNKKKEDLYENKVCNTFGVNYLGTMVILKELQEFLSSSEIERRILVEGSLVATKINYKKGMIRRLNIPRLKKYSISKYGCLCLFEKYVLENKNPNVFYLYAEPGIANTSIIKNFPRWFQKAGYVFMSIFMHSNTTASLSSTYPICNIVANGDGYVPKGIMRIKGMPKKFSVFKCKLSQEFIDDGEEIIKEIYESR